MKVKIFTTGGTIDKIYFDKKSSYEVGHSRLPEFLKNIGVNFEFELEAIFKKDSLDITDEDRQLIYGRVKADPNRLLIITHGTDTMVLTARVLQGIPDKVIVLTGSLHPAIFKGTDADFNIGCAIGAVQSLPAGVYIAMNGRVFHPDKVCKNLDLNMFQETD